MNIKMVSLLAVIATMLSLCACGGQIDANTKGKGQEIGAASSVALNPSSSQTTDQSGGETGTTSGQTEIVSGQTEINPSQTTETTKATTTTTRALEVLKRGISTWKEVPIKEGAYHVTATFSGLDLRETINNADYVFSGTVIGQKEYEVSWLDENGESWGPYNKSILEVKVNHDYYGQSPVNGNIINVYYPYSLSASFNNSVLIKNQGEYVFITRALDEEFVERKKKESPDDLHEQEKYADVYVDSPCDSLLPIEKGNVIAYRDYFNWNEDIMKKAKPSIETDKISYGKTDPFFVVLDKKDFDEIFNPFFESPEILPSVNS